MSTDTPTLDARIRALGRRLVDRYPALEVPLMRLRGEYASLYLRTRSLTHRLYHEAPVDPFTMFRVDPADIEYRAGKFDMTKYQRAGRIVGGDWDRPRTRFEDSDVFRAFEAHFEEGVPWSETTFFERVLEEIAAGYTRWECDSRAAFERRCERLDDLYRTIRDEGYRTQAELLQAGDESPIERPRHSRVERLLEDEIAVHVGRDGELLFCDGRNRLAIVKLLGLDEVPVRVLVRHERWQRFRDDVAAGRTDPGDYRDHPDVRALVDEQS